MIWFLAPRYFFDGAGDPDATSERPGMLDVDGVTVVPVKIACSFVVQTYDLVNSTCLVGVTSPLPTPPNGWVAVDVKEAQIEFEKINGRASTDAEVF